MSRLPQQAQTDILEQRVTLGMSPYEARLAGGAFYFKVEADLTNWSANADPFNVMWKQSTHPDNSKIWMTFETVTQYPEQGKQRFEVYFAKGRAMEIKQLKEQK